MTFEQWLKNQKKRNDSIGHLANDFAYIKKVKKLGDIKCNQKHLYVMGASQYAFDGLLAAYKEYRKLMLASKA